MGCRFRVGFPGPAGRRAGLSRRGEIRVLASCCCGGCAPPRPGQVPPKPVARNCLPGVGDPSSTRTTLRSGCQRIRPKPRPFLRQQVSARRHCLATPSRRALRASGGGRRGAAETDQSRVARSHRPIPGTLSLGTLSPATDMPHDCHLGYTSFTNEFAQTLGVGGRSDRAHGARCVTTSPVC